MTDIQESHYDSMRGSMSILEVLENSDGSATYTVDLDESAKRLLISIGLKFSFYCLSKNISIEKGFEMILAENSKTLSHHV